MDVLEKVGDQIKRAGESYDIAHKRLSSGKSNLVGRTHKLKVHGAKTKKAIGNELLEEALENDDELDLPTDEVNPGLEAMSQISEDSYVAS